MAAPPATVGHPDDDARPVDLGLSVAEAETTWIALDRYRTIYSSGPVRERIDAILERLTGQLVDDRSDDRVAA